MKTNKYKAETFEFHSFDDLVNYYEEHIPNTIIDQLFDNELIEDTDDEAMELVRIIQIILLTQLLNTAKQ